MDDISDLSKLAVFRDVTVRKARIDHILIEKIMKIKSILQFTNGARRFLGIFEEINNIRNIEPKASMEVTKSLLSLERECFKTRYPSRGGSGMKLKNPIPMFKRINVRVNEKAQAAIIGCPT